MKQVLLNIVKGNETILIDDSELVNFQKFNKDTQHIIIYIIVHHIVPLIYSIKIFLTIFIPYYQSLPMF
jgi:hypothetical protein